MFCSLNFLFSNVPVGVATLVFLNSLIFFSNVNSAFSWLKKNHGESLDQSLFNTLQIYRKEQIGRQGTKVSLWLIEKRGTQPSKQLKVQEKTCSWRMCERGAIGFGFHTVWTKKVWQTNADYLGSQVKIDITISHLVILIAIIYPLWGSSHTEYERASWNNWKKTKSQPSFTLSTF